MVPRGGYTFQRVQNGYTRVPFDPQRPLTTHKRYHRVFVSTMRVCA